MITFIHIPSTPCNTTTKTYREGERYTHETVHSFTGKELDAETGYSYFGARYYDPATLAAWLSVDPMADKYPSISPYAYCAWNPLKLVDPDGDSVVLSGNVVSQSQTIEWMNNSSNHISYSLTDDGKLIGNLKAGIGVEKLTFEEKHMLSIISDPQNYVNVELQDNDQIAPGYYIRNVAQWNGSIVYRPDETTQIVTGEQFVNVLALKEWQNNSDCPRLAGLIIGHEIAEGYESCLLTRAEHRSLSPFSPTSAIDYQKCHSNANLYFWGEIKRDPETNKIDFNVNSFKLR